MDSNNTDVCLYINETSVQIVCVCVCAGLSWVVGDAEELPFDDDQFDIYTIAFGIRNVTHVEQVKIVFNSSIYYYYYFLHKNSLSI